ncbi:hypothetical protein [Haloferax sp. YSMS24]|uniref:hypothetical protein n=1 Tax=Haloferax sp. YSMS24 TaxID=3388425 RepID=UPI00398CAE46
MRRRSAVLFVVLLFVVATTATGTQSLSASELDRGISAAVVSDDEAYLGYVADVDDEGVLTVELTNSLQSEPTLDVVVELSNGSVTTTNTTTLSPGQREQLEFGRVSCDATIGVVATGQSVGIELLRPVPCDDSAFDDGGEDGEGSEDEDGGDDEGEDEDDGGVDGDQ